MKNVAIASVTTVAAAALVVGVAPSASAEIDPGVGIRGVEVGMSKSQVFDTVGKPRVIVKKKANFGKYKEYRYGKGKKFVVLMKNRKVIEVETRSVNQRTPSGVGVGTNSSELLREVPGINCKAQSNSRQVCTLGKTEVGNIVTIFRLKNNVTKMVEVARVLTA